MNAIERLARRIRLRFERDHDILGKTIRLPAGHMLDWIRLHHKRYDMPLCDVAEVVVRKYPRAAMIDIGANIGDSAAFLAMSNDAPILCIEGNPAFLHFLKKNLAVISSGADVVTAYISAQDGEVSGEIVSNHGTAKFVDGAGTVKVRSLQGILDEYPLYKSAKLIKIDTDGHDAKIIAGASSMLQTMKPALFFEYYPFGSATAAHECRSAMHTLEAIGYTHFHVFDNFGNHMVRVDNLDQMRALTAYVRATNRGQRPSLNYYDICAFHEDDNDLSERLLKRYDWDS